MAALIGCPDPGVESAARSDAIVAQMTRLEDELREVRNAIVRGDLPDARSRAGKASEGYVAVPGAPEGADQALKTALAAISGASTLEAAALGLGETAAACAACHTASNAAGPDRPVWAVQAQPAEMARHAMDLDRLWLAAIRPSEDDLRAAVEGIAAAAAAPDATGIDHRLRDLSAKLGAATPAGRPAALAEIVTACASCHTPAGSLVRPRLDGVTLPPMADEMSEHFVRALELQLAVVAGDLDQVHRTATAVVTRKRDPRYPDAAAPFLDAIQRSALTAALATTVEDAGVATAEVAVACGQCHTATGGGPKDPMPAPPIEPHMAKHLFGAYWMIYGLQAPDERAWVGGAEALATAPMLPEGTTSVQVDGADERVHTLAKEAGAATEPAARAQALGKLLAACAPCHQKLPNR